MAEGESARRHRARRAAAPACRGLRLRGAQADPPRQRSVAAEVEGVASSSPKMALQHPPARAAPEVASKRALAGTAGARTEGPPVTAAAAAAAAPPHRTAAGSVGAGGASARGGPGGPVAGGAGGGGGGAGGG